MTLGAAGRPLDLEMFEPSVVVRQIASSALEPFVHDIDGNAKQLALRILDCSDCYRLE